MSNLSKIKAVTARLRELRKKATQGEWFVKECRDGVYSNRKCLVETFSGEVVPRQLGYKQDSNIEHNIDYIAESANKIEALCDALDLAVEHIKATCFCDGKFCSHCEKLNQISERLGGE